MPGAVSSKGYLLDVGAHENYPRAQGEWGTMEGLITKNVHLNKVKRGYGLK
jgi:hypothetical protein